MSPFSPCIRPGRRWDRMSGTAGTAFQHAVVRYHQFCQQIRLRFEPDIVLVDPLKLCTSPDWLVALQDNSRTLGRKTWIVVQTGYMVQWSAEWQKAGKKSRAILKFSMFRSTKAKIKIYDYLIQQAKVTNVVFFSVNKFMDGLLAFDFRFWSGQ